MTKIPFLELGKINSQIKNQLDSAYRRVMNSGWYVMGPELEAFESDFATYSEVKYCVGVGNGLDALLLILKAYEIGPGDEVIVPSNTFIATWLAVSQCGAKPIPVEPDIDTYNINPECIEAVITKRTRAIIPVHLYGLPADMDSINELAKRYDLIVIEDAAQSHGARYKGRKVGSLGHAAGTSFYPGKNLGALGDGGAILTNDQKTAEKVRKLRNYGSMIKYQHEINGHNSRLDELQAAFLREKLKVLDAWNHRRALIAESYNSRLLNLGLVLPIVPLWADPTWHLYVVRSVNRGLLMNNLAAAGVETAVHYPMPPHKQAVYASQNYGQLKIAELFARQVLSLPISPSLTDGEVDFVITEVQRAARLD